MIKQFVGAVFLLAVFGNAHTFGMDCLDTWQGLLSQGVVRAGSCPVLGTAWRDHARGSDPEVGTLDCGHSLCLEAIEEMMRKTAGKFMCPECRNARCTPNRSALRLLRIAADLQKLDPEVGLAGNCARARRAQAHRYLFTSEFLPGLWDLALRSGERWERSAARERRDCCNKFTRMFYAGLACGATGGCIAGILLAQGFWAVLEGTVWAAGGVGGAMLPIAAAYAFYSSRRNGYDGAYDPPDLSDEIGNDQSGSESADEEELEVVVVRGS